MNPTNDDIDPLLHAWSKQHVPSREHLAALQRNILGQAVAAKTVTDSAIQTQWLNPTSFASLLTLTCTALLVCCSQFWVSNITNNVGRATKEVQPFLALLPERHIKLLTREFEALFGNRLAWLAETSDEVSLGLDALPNVVPSNMPFVAVRIVLLRRVDEHDNWQLVWSEDVIARAESLVETSSSQHGSQLSLWTHILPDGAMSIDTRLDLQGRGEVPQTRTSIQQPRESIRLFDMQHGLEEYQVWQTALVLPERAL